MSRNTILLTVMSLVAWPQEVAAEDHEVPRVLLHAPRGQTQKPGLGGYEWWPRTPADTGCPEGPQPHGDVFGAPRGKVEVKAGAHLFARFHTASRPTLVRLRAKKPTSLGYTLVPYAPDGPTLAWDMKFKSPRFEGDEAADVYVYAEWPDGNCPEYVQWAAWNMTLTRRG